MKYLFLDHCSIMFRAYYAMRSICERTHNIQAAVGLYANWLNQFKNQFQADVTISVYDVNNRQANNFELYDAYKAGRHIDNLFKQGMPKFEQIDAELGYARIGISGHEADDVICSLIKQGTTTNDEVSVISSDKDLLQLVTRNVTVYSQLNGSKLKAWQPDTVRNKFNIDEPYLIADLKALIGDTSDGYPGVKGIGPATATKLLHYYHSFENLYRAVAKGTVTDIVNKTYTNKLKTYYNDAFICYQLAKLDEDIKISSKTNTFS